MLEPNMMMFAKMLQSLPLEEAGRRMKAIGFDRVDLTVREGGFVAPERARDELPKAAETLGELGLEIGMITTNITTPAMPDTEAVLRTAAELGIEYYKIGYVRYPRFGSLRQLRAETLARFRELAALNLELGIVGGYHNHAGDYFGANIHDIAWVLDRLPREGIGLYFDGGHATLEGGGQGFKMGLDLIGDRVVMLAVKDHCWMDRTDTHHAGRRQGVKGCPLEDGNVRWPGILELLDELNFSGPASFHSEYEGRPGQKPMTLDELMESTARDKALFEQWVETARHANSA